MESSKIYAPIGSWSTALQHKDAEVLGPRLTRTADTTYGWVIHGLGDTALDDTSQIPYRCSFEIVNMGKGLIVGICQPAKIIKHKFVGWDAKLDHGKYGMDSNGNVKSDWDQSIADVEVGFRYTSGDIIEMEYIPMEERLIFRKGKDKFQMKISPNKGKEYRIFALLCGTEASVQLKN